MTELKRSIENALQDAALPVRLRDRVRDTLVDREVDDKETAEEIIQAVKYQYEDTRVDPLEPVGTVSAQSIGEPGTQMSIPYDEEVLIRRSGTTSVSCIGSIVDDIIESRPTRTVDDSEVALAGDFEVLSLGEDEQIHWKTVEEVSRHETPDELLRISTGSGREIRATKSHSFVTRDNNEVVPVRGDALEVGDVLPVVRSFSIDDPQDSIRLLDHLPTTDFWSTDALTDGGVSLGVDQTRNRLDALDRGEIPSGTVFPVGGSVGLPTELPLDELTGFFIGAWLAEGSAMEYYVSISNTDEAFQERIRSFANRYSLTVNEYENESGFSTGYDLRLNGKVLAEFISSTCVDDGRKQVPSFAYGASDEFVSGLLSGYFSGDGNVGKNAVRASSTSDELRHGIALLLGRFGIHATVRSDTIRIPKKFVSTFAECIDLVGDRALALEHLVESVDRDGPDSTDQIPNFGDSVADLASELGYPSRQFNSATKRQQLGRTRLAKLVEEAKVSGIDEEFIRPLEQAVKAEVVWDPITRIETIEDDHDYVYDFSVPGLETFTTSQGVVTHNTMNTFHYAGVAEIDVTQGLPRLIELVDARKEPDTPMMTVYLDGEYATDREKAHEVVWQIEATRILSLGDVSTNVADMRVQITLNEQTLEERMIEPETIHERIESELGVEAALDGNVIEFGPERPSYRELLGLVENLRNIVFKGIKDISRVVIRKEELEDGEEFVLYTEGSAFGDVLSIEGVDTTRTITNDIHETKKELGVEAAREAIIHEMMETLEEQGLDDVNVRHLMLVADIMTNTGDIASIGRHGISGSKESVLARAAFEVTVNHLLDAAVLGEEDILTGVTENVIVGKPIKLGTGDVNLRVGAAED